MKTLVIAITLCLGNIAQALPGEIKGFQSMSCNDSQACVKVASSSMIVSTDGRVLAGETATITWYNSNRDIVRTVEVLDPVFFLSTEVVSWEGEKGNETKGDFVDLRFGK